MATTLIKKVKEMLRCVSQKWHHELSQILRANVTSLKQTTLKDKISLAWAKQAWPAGCLQQQYLRAKTVFG